jgi:hypothetical protein
VLSSAQPIVERTNQTQEKERKKKTAKQRKIIAKVGNDSESIQ